MDTDPLLLLLIFMLGSGDHAKNPNTRGKVTTMVQELIKNNRYAARLQEFQPIVRNIIPSCIRVFTAVEKTKQSYYDIRFQLK